MVLVLLGKIALFFLSVITILFLIVLPVLKNEPVFPIFRKTLKLDIPDKGVVDRATSKEELEALILEVSSKINKTLESHQDKVNQKRSEVVSITKQIEVYTDTINYAQEKLEQLNNLKS